MIGIEANVPVRVQKLQLLLRLPCVLTTMKWNKICCIIINASQQHKIPTHKYVLRCWKGVSPKMTLDIEIDFCWSLRALHLYKSIKGIMIDNKLDIVWQTLFAHTSVAESKWLMSYRNLAENHRCLGDF